MTPEQITTQLGGIWHGTYGRAICPSCHGGEKSRNLPLSVALGHTGNTIVHCFKGCTFQEISAALKSNGTHIPISRATDEDLRIADMAQRARNLKSGQIAKRTWDESLPITGTLGETYLRGRGIKIDLPDTLRFQTACWHPSAKRYPAIIARVDGAEFFAIHRTYLSDDGMTKADAEPQKAMLGKTKGGAVILSKGSGPLVICEGIETGLSLVQLLAGRQPQVWAALSTSGITSLRLPHFVGRLTIAPDGDDAGLKAAGILDRRARKAGWTVSTLPAPPKKDFNDILRESQENA